MLASQLLDSKLQPLLFTPFSEEQAVEISVHFQCISATQALKGLFFFGSPCDLDFASLGTNLLHYFARGTPKTMAIAGESLPEEDLGEPELQENLSGSQELWDWLKDGFEGRGGEGGEGRCLRGGGAAFHLWAAANCTQEKARLL